MLRRYATALIGGARGRLGLLHSKRPICRLRAPRGLVHFAQVICVRRSGSFGGYWMRRHARIMHDRRRAAIAAALLIALPHSVHAGGFGLEQSAYYQGLSFAGAAAGGESLAAISWNPATATFAGEGLLGEVSASAVFLFSRRHGDEPRRANPAGRHVRDRHRQECLDRCELLYVSLRRQDGVCPQHDLAVRPGTKPNDTEWAGRTKPSRPIS